MILDVREMAELTEAMRAHGVATLEIEEGGSSIRLTAAAHAGTPAAKPTCFVPSPGVGHFVTARIAGEVYAAPGSNVEKGQVIGLITVGLIRRAVVSPVAGILQSVLLAPGALADFGAALFEISPYQDAAASARPEDA